jgi:hypothetical protein
VSGVVHRSRQPSTYRGASVETSELYQRVYEDRRAFYLPSCGEGYLALVGGAPSVFRPSEVGEEDFFGSAFVALAGRDLITAVHWPRQTQLDLLYFMDLARGPDDCEFRSPEGRFEMSAKRVARARWEVRVHLQGVGPRAAEELETRLVISDIVASRSAWQLADFLPGIGIHDLDLP